MTRYTKGQIALAALCAVPLPGMVTAYADAPPAADHVFIYHQTNILGTSFDLKVIASTQAEADACQQTILKEVERLRVILSTYDKDSEISKFQANASKDPIPVSRELHAVLFDYGTWRTASGGAYTAQLGELIDLWNAAEKKGAPPTDAEIAPVLARIKQNALSSVSETLVHKLSDQKLNIDSLGKGYIVQKAAALAKVKHPLVTGILLNIGGDVTALGLATPPGVKPPDMWKITITDPENSADNAPPLMTLKVKDAAVATSGSYERFYTFGDKKLTHILNPLTGKPSENGVLSATVIAPDNATANALATILCVLPTADGMKLVEKTPGTAAMVAMAGNKQIASKGFAAYQEGGATIATGAGPTTAPASGGSGAATGGAATGAAAAGGKAIADGWPKNYILNIDFTQIPYAPHPNYIPYTTMWIEDANGNCVKILAAWVGDKKYLQVMRTFMKECSKAADFATSSRASRRPGQYNVIWDGTDANNNPVPKGQYNLCIETACEHAGHANVKQLIDCGASAQSASIPGAVFWNPIPVTYGPAKAKGS